ALTMAAAAVIAVAGAYMYLAPQLPDADELREVRLQEPLRVYDRHGALIAVYGSKRRIPLALDEIPEPLRHAFIAAEDDRFYEHPGVDWMGIARAAVNLLLTGEKGQGGSTITMQVARNFFLSRAKTYIRKMKEILLALKIERRLDKDAILELYLNKIYLGERAYGVGAAAQAYYGRSVDELTLAQMATIAGLPTAPSRLNPVSNPDQARSRRRYVLSRMYELGMIDTAAFDEARTAPVTATPHDAAVAIDAPFVGEMARLEAVERFGESVYTAGYRVYTTIDGDKQQAATRALRQGLLDYETRYGYTGPLQRLDPRRLPEVNALRRQLEGGARDGDANASERDGVLGRKGLGTALEPYTADGPVEAAVVLRVRDDGAMVYRASGALTRVPWAGMDWAAPRGDDGAVGAAPEHVAPADAGGDWRLVQIPEVEGALVALDPASGALRALRGGYDFDRSQFNRVTQARRQPGSNFKPFIYSAALADGFTPATLVNDAPVVFDDPALEDTWRPENYSGRVFGPTRLREGLVYSRNLVSIRILIEMGIPYAIDYVQRFGFPEEQLPHDLTLALGSASLSPLQVARGYATFANMGFRVRPYLVTRMATNDGEVV
ncbi:MAG: peptidase, partial [Proteobacteria bacterium SW_6_67_9]